MEISETLRRESLVVLKEALVKAPTYLESLARESTIPVADSILNFARSASQHEMVVILFSVGVVALSIKTHLLDRDVQHLKREVQDQRF